MRVPTKEKDLNLAMIVRRDTCGWLELYNKSKFVHKGVSDADQICECDGE